MIRSFVLFVALLIAAPALAQTYPPLTGRVVDQADLLNPQQEAELNAKLEALEQASSRQLVVVTVPDLQGREIEEYGVGLGRAWGIGQRGANNGIILIVAVQERKMRIEVGYGLEGIMTDALSSQIINRDIRPRFREGDYPGGINAGADAIIAQLQAPPEAAEQRVRAAAETRGRRGGAGSFIPLIFWAIVFVFIIFSLIRRGIGGKRYRGRRGRRGPVIIWGPGLGGGWGGGGSSSWGSGGGSSWGGGGGGGFSGGGGSFGGGGASGGW
ncbi:MAG TPA: TPM domain-containing protein [Allosphingosinicella sp.]|nr:TPM domain-containing protein [Allosphingosinicella sp.]